MRQSSLLWRWFVAVVLLLTNAASGYSSQETPEKHAEWSGVVNAGTVRILTKGLGCTCTHIASDMASVLNEHGKLRVLPVIGHGSLQGTSDVIYLDGIDMSILQSDVLAYVKRTGRHPGVDRRLRFITKLYNSELHLLARQGIDSIHDLNGQAVNFDVKGRGSAITAQNVFDALNIKIRKVNFERDVAIEKLRTGEIAASFVVTGKPASSMRSVKPGDGLHFVSIPFVTKLADAYIPGKLTHDDYPQLIKPGETVRTISVGEVLAVYNWHHKAFRYKKLKVFVEELFSNIQKFHSSVRHPKWKDVNLAASVPGWSRFKPAQDWLNDNMRELMPHSDELRKQFRQFLVEQEVTIVNLTPKQKEEVFRHFSAWIQK